MRILLLGLPEKTNGKGTKSTAPGAPEGRAGFSPSARSASRARSGRCPRTSRRRRRRWERRTRRGRSRRCVSSSRRFAISGERARARASASASSPAPREELAHDALVRDVARFGPARAVRGVVELAEAALVERDERAAEQEPRVRVRLARLGRDARRRRAPPSAAGRSGSSSSCGRPSRGASRRSAP